MQIPKHWNKKPLNPKQHKIQDSWNNLFVELLETMR